MSDYIVTRRGVMLGGLASGALLVGLGGVAEAVPTAGPPIIDCDGWGARPNSRIVQVVRARPVKIIVHHTATANVEDYGRGAAEQIARAIQDFHMDRRGWIDSGQHFTISRGGFVLEGRRRSLEALRSGRKQVEGAHCTGQNLVSIGIENEGTYTGTGPPGILWDRLREMCAYVCSQYGIAPGEIFGHRDFKDTQCPGDILNGLLPRLRVEVGDLLGLRVTVSSSLQGPSWPLLREGDRGPVVLAAQHLLRAAGAHDLTPDGEFGPAMAAAVRRFQVEHATEEINGLIGGESWPLLTRSPASGDDEALRAVAALGDGGSARVPSTADETVWRELLSRAAG